MRDCANCFHRKPVLKEDGTWTAECEKWDCEFQSRENMIEKTKAMNNDLISRSALKEAIRDNPYLLEHLDDDNFECILGIIDNAPTVEAVPLEFHEKCMDKTVREMLEARPKGEWVHTDNRWGLGEWECNKCHGYSNARDNFCSNCGADMRGENNEAN